LDPSRGGQGKKKGGGREKEKGGKAERSDNSPCFRGLKRGGRGGRVEVSMFFLLLIAPRGGGKGEGRGVGFPTSPLLAVPGEEGKRGWRIQSPLYPRQGEKKGKEKKKRRNLVTLSCSYDCRGCRGKKKGKKKKREYSCSSFFPEIEIKEKDRI